ncbi:MAG: hypothetical protein U9Q82_08970 [Chloroflexota bacterium]|nr:hypothetical protein [Chloroflexota bacterium]
MSSKKKSQIPDEEASPREVEQQKKSFIRQMVAMIRKQKKQKKKEHPELDSNQSER